MAGNVFLEEVRYTYTVKVGRMEYLVILIPCDGEKGPMYDASASEIIDYESNQFGATSFCEVDCETFGTDRAAIAEKVAQRLYQIDYLQAEEKRLCRKQIRRCADAKNAACCLEHEVTQEVLSARLRDSVFVPKVSALAAVEILKYGQTQRQWHGAKVSPAMVAETLLSCVREANTRRRKKNEQPA